MNKKNKSYSISFIYIIITIIFIFFVIHLLLNNNIENFVNNDNYILPKTVYVYWDNLDGNDIIQAHINTISRNLNSDWNLLVLTKKNIDNYIDPIFLNKFKYLNSVRFSDFLRLELLSKNGGVWMDAGTILINGDFLDKYYNEMIQKKADVLLYELNDHSTPKQPYLENWFLMAPKNSLFINDLYNEFIKSFDMDFINYKFNVLAPVITFDKIMKGKNNTYHMQHGIINYLLLINKNKYKIIIKDANESMFKAQKKNNWNSDNLIKYIIENNDWNDYYAIKLVNFNRKSITPFKDDFINKLNSL